MLHAQRMAVLGLCLFQPILWAADTAAPSRPAHWRRLRVVVTVAGEGTDWQNRMNTLAARIRDAFGRCEHITANSLEDMVDQIEVLAHPWDRTGKQGHCIETLSIWSHGYLGTVSFGKDLLSLETLKAVAHLSYEWDEACVPARWRVKRVSADDASRRRALLERLRACLLCNGEERARVNVEACAVGLGQRGRSFVLNLADLLDADVFCITGEHLGIRRFGDQVLVRPGDPGRPWDPHLVSAGAVAEDPRAYYSLASFGLRQQILDYEPKRQDKRAGVVIRVGPWQTASALKGFFGTGYLTDNNANKGRLSAHYRPIIPVGGTYAVQIWYPAAPGLATHVPIAITHAQGTTHVFVDQTRGGGEWRDLGRYPFAAGKWTTGGLVLSNAHTQGAVVADAARFVSPVSETEVYLANQAAIERLVQAGQGQGRSASQRRESLVGNAWGLDPGHKHYGKLERCGVREDRRCATSQAWRAGRLDRFSERERSCTKGRAP